MARSRYNNELQEKAYQDVMNGGGTAFSLAYLLRVIHSGQYSAAGLDAIAAGVESALKDKGYA